jgi:26S proteasome regulatory subunit N10
LALKHRQNKSQRQRIIVFTCSQIYEEKSDLIRLAKKMKKNNVAVDFIAFGDLDDSNVQKLETFNENVKSTGGEGSHLAIIHPGPQLLSDQLVSTPILSGDGVAPRGGGDTEMGGAGGGETGAGFEFGVDPNLEPELALALRISMEEENQRRAKEDKAKQDADKEKMEGIPEEQPLLDANGEASGSGEAAQQPEEKKDGEGGDKMDTA